ncbi:MAG: HPr(Ser) kinase/phosphatase [Lachnospiraceae bacterium]|nr:HPr(Ser) kinase/phosphatase [Lachnospiraceae bacterium]
MEEGAKLSVIAEKLGLKNFTPKIKLENKMVTTSEINRPALQLHGFFDHFEPRRIQLIGMVEYSYLQSEQSRSERLHSFEELMDRDIPCIIFCRGFTPEERLLKVARNKNVPILGTERGTSEFMAELINTLSFELAPMTSIHGVLVDVYGEGLLITGESGIGKSEAALELIRRGHRLVSDDVVEIRRTSSKALIGSAPATLRHLIELRGIGIIDVKSLFGVECVKDSQKIDFVIKLEDWRREAEYDRLGMSDEYMEILGNQVVCHSLPIRPGRNLAVICETAAVNHRQKKMGYNAAEELYRRVNAQMEAAEK